MKVLHCPTDTGGNPWYLSRAERKLGIQSDMAVFRTTWLKYPADINLHFERTPMPFREVKRFLFFKRAIKKYDVFHFNFGRSILDYPFSGLLNYLDFPLLKKMGKKIIVTFQGCDGRLKYFCIRNFEISACAECNVWYCNKILDKFKERRIRKVLKYADHVFVLNPDLLHVIPDAEFLPYCIDIYRFIKMSKRCSKETDDEKIRILHAPTNRSKKGTKYILQAYERLKSKKYPVELILVEKMPYEKAIRMYINADIVVDQLLVGWYGAFAVETMALGKPVVCYLRQEDLDFLPFKDRIPIINANPYTICDVMENLINDRDQLNKIGKRCLRYVTKVHDPIKIAKRTIKIYME